MYQEVFEARKIFAKNEFHSKLFDATIANYFELNNPIRFNNFCYSIRELIREKLDSEASDDLIRECEWYKPQPDNKIPRKDKVRYYIAKGFSDSVIPSNVLIELYKAISKLLYQYKILNKYTHITESSFGIDLHDGDKLFRDILKAITNCFVLIEQVKSSIENEIIDKIQSDIDDKLRDEIPDEIDILSSHSSVEEVTDVDISIRHIGSCVFTVHGNCNVGVDLQWGSCSDMRNGDGGEFSTSFPMSFQIEVSTSDLNARTYYLDEIDTSSFHE